ncbi:MAG: GerMN domain-containing protein, partial [Chloroflexota bacterium]|nr:GerMN domain-containing protein [Chloroflexota bacterium]
TNTAQTSAAATVVGQPAATNTDEANPVLTATAEPDPTPEVTSEVPDVSPNETSVPEDATTAVKPNTGTGIDYPADGAQVTFPIHVQARVGRLHNEVVLKIKWQDGQEYSERYPVLFDKEGNGLLVDSLDWTGESAPPEWPSQPATLQLLSPSGAVIASRRVNYLSASDPNTMEVKVYWLLDEGPREITRRIVRTRQVGAASLTELLWGIGPRNFAGFTTAVPSPEEVLNYAGRQSDWGPRVRLRKLTIVEGVATADFTKEMAAYGGGSARVNAIQEQITLTLKQFPSVKEVRILVDGKPDALQP